jgi:phage FluMu gp28-like protein
VPPLTVEITYNRPFLYPKQEAALFCEERFSAVEASTKSGKTVGCIAWILEQAMKGGRGHNYWWVAPIYGQAHIAYTRMRDGLPDSLYIARESDLTITLVNGSVIWFKTADKPNHLYGEDVYGCVLDEASRMKEDSWIAIRTTVSATRAPVRIIGNVKGRKNWFYRFCRRAEGGAAGRRYSRLTADDAIEAGILDREEVEDAALDMPEGAYRELFYAEAADDQSNPFGLKHIEACVVPALAPADPVCWGIDLAKSVDWTVLTALGESGSVCDFDRFQRPWEETFSDILEIVGTTPSLVDSTGVGDPIVERLQAEGGGNFEGYTFTPASKQKLMAGLRVAIQRQEVWYPEGPIADELREFEYVYSERGVKYSAPQGLHDDCVMSLALAVRHLGEATMPLQVY